MTHDKNKLSASNLQYDGDQRMIDRSFGFLDQEGYSNIHGMRPHIFNCRSEPSIPPRLNMEPLSQVSMCEWNRDLEIKNGLCIILLAEKFHNLLP